MGSKVIGNKYAFRQFHLEYMVEDPAICMIAKRGSGKSWIVRAILKKNCSIPVGAVIAPTDKMSSFYGDFIPESYVHHTFKPEIIERILKRQMDIINKNRKKNEQGKKINVHAWLVMDDCMSDKKIWTSTLINTLFFEGRHYKLMYILTMQYSLGIKPELRTNFDYVFLLADDMITNQKRIYDHYAGMFESFDEFRNVYLELTKDFGAMVIINRGLKNEIYDKIFWYKADNPHIRSIGCPQYQIFHHLNYNKDWRDKAVSKMFTNTKKPMNVKKVDY